MLTLDYASKMLSSLIKEDGEFSFSDVYNWYEKYNYELTHSKYPVNSNDIAVDKILQNDVWEDIAIYLRYYLDDFVDSALVSLLNKVNRFFELTKFDLLDRKYSDEEKALILEGISNDYNVSVLTKNEVIFYKNLAFESADKNEREGLLAVGYGSYGGDGIFECDYKLSEKCMLKLMETVDKIPEKGRYANTLGYIYYYGRTNNGVPDYQKAYMYFSFGASCGVYEAIYKLSDMYLNGYGGIKSPACARKLLYDIYEELYSLFLNEIFDCEFADVALRLGNFAMNEACDGYPTYTSALNYFMEAKYALSKRNKFGDEGVRERIEKSISEVKEKMDFELVDELEICSLDYILWKNSGRDMIAAISKVSNKKYNLNIKINREKNENGSKLFACYCDMGVCGLYDEINVTVDTFGDIKECVFEFNDVSYKDFMMGDETVYRLPHNCSFLITPDIVL